MSDVRTWLAGIGLGQYAGAFAANDIDTDLLKEIDDQTLKEIGVASAGHRLRIRTAIARLAATSDLEPKASGAVAAPEVSAPSAERRQLTVMFCDLVGSTALSARMDPEDLREVIAAYQGCVADTIRRFDGFVAKYMGDGVLVYFGYPQAHEDDAERSVRAGLILVNEVPKLVAAAGSPLQVRVGIATGLVVVGDLLGEGAAQEQAVVGETPNLAARLQALAEPGAVVIASSTHRLTGGLFEYRDLGIVALKGFAENVPAWQVLAASAAESRFEALRASTTPLVGRDEEIDLLMRRWEQAKRGDGSVVLLSGEPGIGKSRIAQTVVERLAGERHTSLRYFCSPHHQDSALYPSITQLERAAGFRREDADTQRLDKLAAVLSRATNELREAVPLLADLLSIPVGDRYPSLNLTPQKRKEKTLLALIAQIEGLAGQQPVLMVVEDAHWSDPTTRESLDLLIDRVSALRILVIITFRPEFMSPWVGRPQVTLLSLSRLAPQRRAKMIIQVTGGKALPKEITDQIIDRTDGVPLFIEELTKAVVESGILTDTGDHYTATGPIAPLAIPTTLHGSLLARLDRLAPAREVAQIGAALGRQFSHELISAVAQMPPQQLDDALAQLVGSELIFRRGAPPDAEYTFKHALVQDTAYSTLLRSRRRQIHARIATTLENQFPEIAAAQPALMAQHLTEAGLTEKAVGCWIAAGRQSVAGSAMLEALARLQKGIDLLPSMPDGALRHQQELDLKAALGPALIATKGWSAPEVGETIARARLLAEQLERPDYLIPLLYGQWAYCCVRAEHKEALSLAQRLEQTGERSGEAVALLLGHFLHGITQYFLGNLVSAESLFNQCHDLRDPHHRAAYAALIAEDPYPVMLAYHGTTSICLGNVLQGLTRIGEAESEARRVSHLHSLVFVLLFVAGSEWLAGSPHAAQRISEGIIALANEHGFSLMSAWGAVNRGWSVAALGQADEGLALLMTGLSMMRAAGAINRTPWVLLLLSDCYRRIGRYVDGLSCIKEAQEIIETTDERRDEAELHRLRGDLLNSTGDRAAAELSYHHALAVAERQSAKLFKLRAATSLARFWRDQGRHREAHDLLAPVYGWFTEGLDTPILQEAKTLLETLAA